jgi:alpha-galactosidase
MKHTITLLLSFLLIAYASAQSEPPVKIYLMVGQSNMQGKGGIEGDAGNTLRHLVNNDPKKEYQFAIDDKGEWVERKDVWIHYDLHPFRELRYGLLKPGYGASSGQVGPEFGFGHAMGNANKGKVLLIKAAWGGKSIGHNFLPPSIGKYPAPAEPELDPGYFYHRTLQLVDEVTGNMKKFFPDYNGQGVEIAGICWHQGWNDQYGGHDANYETNLAAFIKDIRSTEHGLGIPNLPFVIASSGMIKNESPVVQGQLAIGDTKKYPEFVGNVAVINTDKPYGPNKMTFKFDNNGVTEKVGYHWNNNARSYTNIGIAMAGEMLKLKRPKEPSRLIAHGDNDGVQLHWQLGSEIPNGITIMRNGKNIGAKLSPTQTTYTDPTALPGANSYELTLTIPSGEKKLSASCDTSVTELNGYRSLDGVMLSWNARGKYKAFQITRDGKVIAEALPADARSYEDKTAPAKGKVVYSIQPSTGKSTPATIEVRIGQPHAGGALVYEPFDYPSDAEVPQSLLGKSGALGTTGAYVTLDERPKHLPKIVAGGLSHGALPVTGNKGHAGHHGSKGCAIQLDGSLKKAGLLDDGAEVWIGFLFRTLKKGPGVNLSLQSDDGKEAIGFIHKGVTESYVFENGKEKKRLFVKGIRAPNTYLFVAKMVWGKDGQPDQWIPYFVADDLKLPEKHGRIFTEPFNIDQSKLSRLVLKGGDASHADEIRVGPTFESVVGAGTK